MHLALRTFTQAHYDQLGRQLPFEPNVLATTWTRSQARRLWDPTASYSQGALFLVLMREWTADTGATPKQQTLWQRTVGRYLWNSFQQNLGASAALLATTPLDLLDRYSLASATDDLVAPDAAAKFALPQIASWDSQTYSVAKPLGISRTAPVQRTLSAGPGGYDAAYLFGDGGNGLSLEFTSVAKVPMRIRLTRLR